MRRWQRKEDQKNQKTKREIKRKADFVKDQKIKILQDKPDGQKLEKKPKTNTGKTKPNYFSFAYK